MNTTQSSTNTVKELIESILHSYSCIFFNQSCLFGFIIMLTTFMNPISGLYGLLSATAVNIIATNIKLDKINIQTGYYGFNAVLAGVAIGVLFPTGSYSHFLLIASTILLLLLSIMTEGLLKKWYLPYLTLPFLLTLWGVMLTSQQTDDPTGFGLSTINEASLQISINNWANSLCSAIPECICDYFKSMSFVLFQSNMLIGLIITIGVLCCSQTSFLYGAINYIAAYAIYKLIDGDMFNIPFYQFGFNFVFTAIAVGCFYVVPSVKSLLWTLLLIPVQFLIIFAASRFLLYFFLPTYSIAFCTTCFLYLYLLRQHQWINGPVIAYCLERTPEKLAYNANINKDRLKYMLSPKVSLPVLGEWEVTQGHNGEYTHKDSWSHAWDLEIKDEKGKQYSNNGTELTDYYCYGKTVVAPADGTVVSYENNIPDNQPGETNKDQNWGNYIVIKIGEGLYAAICHLKKDSIRCVEGQYVSKGERLAMSGSSGNSPYPHLHFQLQTNPIMGSPTLYYPISNISKATEENNEIKVDAIPEKGDKISNIETDESISTAYNILSYRYLYARKGDKTENWIQKTDVYGYNYLEDAEENKAWYIKNESDFYFIRYEGSKESMLYYFFLSNYKVIFDNKKDWVIKDNVSLNYIDNSWKKLLQNCIITFRSVYRLEYEMRHKKSNSLNSNKIEFTSKIAVEFFNQKNTIFSFKTTILDNYLYAITVKQGHEEEWTMQIQGEHY